MTSGIAKGIHNHWPDSLGKHVLATGLYVGMLLATLPLWLPVWMGGDIAFSFILTGSMKGELGPGSFVLVRQSNHYGIGDIAAYRHRTDSGTQIMILHRIVDRLSDGKYIFKGDANRSTETVVAEQIVGKLVFGVPLLGFIPGAIKVSPVILLPLLAVPLIFKKGNPKGLAKPKKSLFLPTLLVVGLTLPFFSVGLAESFGGLTASLVVIGLLAGCRVMELINPWPEMKILGDLAYLLVSALAMLMVSIPELTEAFQLAIAEF